MEAISYYAIQASSALAEERGAYSTFEGSLWSQGILPVDSLNKHGEGTRRELTSKSTPAKPWTGTTCAAG